MNIEEKRKAITWEFLPEAKSDYIGLWEVLAHMAGSGAPDPGDYDEEDVLEVLEYWIGEDLFEPLQGREGTDELFEWEGTRADHLERLRELCDEEEGFHSKQWGIWFELTEKGRAIDDPSELP